jgi:hypothetical protein
MTAMRVLKRLGPRRVSGCPRPEGAGIPRGWYVGIAIGQVPVPVTRTSADVAVPVTDPIESREGFARLLERIEGNGVRIVLIEDTSRLARELVTRELAILALTARGVHVLTANGDNLTEDSDPSRVMMRQIAGAFHQYEEARLVANSRPPVIASARPARGPRAA